MEALAALAERPLFAAVRIPLERLRTAASLSVQELDRVLGPLAGLRFEPQLKTRRRREPFVPAQSYDGSIVERAAVPTRPGSTHDLMNALVWAAFPESKRAIHARQFAALRAEVEEGQRALPGQRSRLRDRLSMLDEGGIVVATEGSELEIEAALSRAEPAELGALASAGRFSTWVLGHAILEHGARADARSVRGAVALVRSAPDPSDVDRALASALERPDLERWLGRFPSIEVGALLSSAEA